MGEEHHNGWSCHVCGEHRPDERISVHTEDRMHGRVEFRVNVRYCNDRPECLAGAPGVAERWSGTDSDTPGGDDG